MTNFKLLLISNTGSTIASKADSLITLPEMTVISRYHHSQDCRHFSQHHFGNHSSAKVSLWKYFYPFLFQLHPVLHGFVCWCFQFICSEFPPLALHEHLHLPSALSYISKSVSEYSEMKNLWKPCAHRKNAYLIIKWVSQYIPRFYSQS